MMVRNGWCGECMGCWSFQIHDTGLMGSRWAGLGEELAGDIYIHLYLALFWSLVKADTRPVDAKGCWPCYSSCPIQELFSLFLCRQPPRWYPCVKRGFQHISLMGPIFLGKKPYVLKWFGSHLYEFPILKPVGICEEAILKYVSLKTFALLL